MSEQFIAAAQAANIPLEVFHRVASMVREAWTRCPTTAR